ncbi:glucosaminyl-phosphatidylinositol-acyltransferase PIGW [Strix uralensis]|uniref:glucosaminyl-phosphatidylinositol- acyltransferase PIGW n=1 Tax=Strix uralensis TaxID=36305 RepID=UPI003DA6D55A
MNRGRKMSQKQLKEAFISNLNGTSLLEITVGLSLAPLCLLCRGLLLVLYYLHYGKPLSSRKYSLLLDFLVLVSPLLFSCTVLSPIIFFMPAIIAAFCAGIFFKIYSQRKHETRVPFRQIVKDFQKTYLDPGYIPAITVFRVYVNVLTSISILAVDFPQYPRRFAKAETYGTGVMDFGVGAFIFGNALVCPEVRQKSPVTQPKFSSLARQFVSVWPLIFLGVGRLLSVKSIEYHEHTSEYGVHWNFFFTLAFVRLAASLLLAVFPRNTSWIVAINLAVLYQLVLNTTSLKMFILHGSNGRDMRDGFLNANREGLLSLFGYLAIYMASVQVGLCLLQFRNSVKDWLEAVCFLLLTVLLLFIFLHVSQAYADPVSRRMANLSYCIWVLAHSLTFFIGFVVTDLTLVFTKLLVKGSSVPCCWDAVKLPNACKKPETEGVPVGRGGKLPPICLISAINKNQLLFFLLANITTGAVNILIDTIHSKAAFTLCILHLYMFFNCFVMYLLHAKNIVLKFW